MSPHQTCLLWAAHHASSYNAIFSAGVLSHTFPLLKMAERSFIEDSQPKKNEGSSSFPSPATHSSTMWKARGESRKIQGCVFTGRCQKAAATVPGLGSHQQHPHTAPQPTGALKQSSKAAQAHSPLSAQLRGTTLFIANHILSSFHQTPWGQRSISFLAWQIVWEAGGVGRNDLEYYLIERKALPFPPCLALPCPGLAWVSIPWPGCSSLPQAAGVLPQPERELESAKELSNETAWFPV